MWITDTVLLGPKGPIWQWHRNGVVTGHPGRVCMGTLEGDTFKTSWWTVCNPHGARSTLAMAIGLYDPFQRNK